MNADSATNNLIDLTKYGKFDSKKVSNLQGATLSKKGLVWDGKSKTITYDYNISNGYKLKNQTMPVTIEISNGGKATKISLKAKTATYTGKAISVNKATVTGSKGTVTYTYYTDSKCTKKTTKSANGSSKNGYAPVNAGTYYVKATVKADKEYAAATSKVVKLVIKQSSATTVTLKSKKTAYTGKAVSINKASVNGSTGKVTYIYYTDKKCTKKTNKKSNGSSSTGSAPVKPGTYYVKAKVAEDSNYTSVTSSAVKLIITNESTVTLKNKTVKYSGKSISIDKAIVIGSSGKVTYTYYTDSKCTKKTTKKNGAKKAGDAPSKKGTYYVKATVAADKKFKTATSDKVKLIIKK